MPRKTIHYIFFFWLAAFLLISPAGARAQGAEFNVSPDLMFSGPSQNATENLTVRLDGQYIAPANFSNGLGSSEIYRSSITAKYDRYSLNYTFSHFIWQAKDQMPPSIQGRVPWENLHDLNFQARILQGKFWDRWYYWLHAELSSAFEADFPGAVGAGLSGELAFDIYEGWMLGIVAKTLALNPLNSDLFGEATFGFAVHVSQKQLRQALRYCGLASDKEGSERINFSFAFTTASKTYRLADDNPLYSNGYMSMISSKVGAYLDWLALDNLVVSIGPEFIFDRRYRLYNSSGSLESSHVQDDALGGFVGVRYMF